MEENKSTFFLKNLQTALKTGNPKEGFNEITKINNITALANKKKPINEAGYSEPLSKEFFQGDKFTIKKDENKETSKNFNESPIENPIIQKFNKPEEISLESEKQKLKQEAENEKLKAIVNISNAESELKNIKIELKQVIKEYEHVISLQNSEIDIMKIKFEAKYDEKYNERK